MSYGIYVEYVPRCSSPSSVLADKLSRQSTTDRQALKAICHLNLACPAARYYNGSGILDPPGTFPAK